MRGIRRRGRTQLRLFEYQRHRRPSLYPAFSCDALTAYRTFTAADMTYTSLRCDASVTGVGHTTTRDHTLNAVVPPLSLLSARIFAFTQQDGRPSLRTPGMTTARPKAGSGFLGPYHHFPPLLAQAWAVNNLAHVGTTFCGDNEPLASGLCDTARLPYRLRFAAHIHYAALRCTRAHAPARCHSRILLPAPLRGGLPTAAARSPTRHLRHACLFCTASCRGTWFVRRACTRCAAP